MRPFPLEELFIVTSFDDNEGNPLFNLVYQKPVEGSLETMQSIEINLPIYLARVTKFFSVVGEDMGDIMFMGYSKGATDMMAVMNVVDRVEAPWAAHVRGAISLVGVEYGTALSECAIGKDNQTIGQCRTERTLYNAIALLAQNLVASKWSFVENTAYITEALAEIGYAELTQPKDKYMENVSIQFPDLPATLGGAIKDLFFTKFDILHPVSDYENNIQRFKLMAQALADGTALLSYSARTAWWQTHTIPADKLYFAISATESDPGASIGSPLPPDQYINRDGYYGLIAMGAGPLSDGQVPVARELFLPQVHMAMNKAQSAYNMTWVGVFHTTHWEITLDVVFHTPSHWISPFPRGALVKAVANLAASKILGWN